MRRLVLLIPAVAAVLAALPGAAGAVWSSSAGGSGRISATTMQNASGFTAASTTNKGNSGVTLSWTISPSTFVQGYEIVRTSSAGGSVVVAQLPRATATYADAPATTTGVGYTYTIRAGSTAIAWTTTPVTAVGAPTYSKTACTTA